MKPYLYTTILLLCCWEMFSLLPPKSPPAPKSAFEPDTMAGIIHVHSTFSDGSGTPAEIMEAANRANIDFVILTDHNNLCGQKKL